MISYGFTEAEVDGDGGHGSRMMSRNNSNVDDDNLGDQLDFPAYDYLRLKCNLNENYVYSESDMEVPYDVEKPAITECSMILSCRASGLQRN